MDTPFSHLPIHKTGLDAVGLNEFTQACGQEAFTGLARLKSASRHDFLWEFVQGAGKNLFTLTENSWQPCLIPALRKAASQSSLDVYRASVSADGLRACNVILGNLPLVETTLMANTAVKAEIEAAFSHSQPGIIRVQHEKSEWYALSLGQGIPFMEGVAFEESETWFFIENLDGLPASHADQVRYSFTPVLAENDAWTEYHLRLAFKVLVRLMFMRFSEMVGRTLAARLCVRLTENSHAWGWDIAFDVNGVAHHHLFDSTSQAAQAYTSLLARFTDAASGLLGPRMASELASAAAQKMSASQRELLSTYISSFHTPRITLQDGSK